MPSISYQYTLLHNRYMRHDELSHLPILKAGTMHLPQRLVHSCGSGCARHTMLSTRVWGSPNSTVSLWMPAGVVWSAKARLLASYLEVQKESSAPCLCMAPVAVRAWSQPTQQRCIRELSPFVAALLAALLCRVLLYLHVERAWQ